MGHDVSTLKVKEVAIDYSHNGGQTVSLMLNVSWCNQQHSNKPNAAMHQAMWARGTGGVS